MKPTIRSAIVTLAVLASVAWTLPPVAAQTDAEPAPDYIGNATMEPDGTLVLWLRAETLSGATVGHGTIRVAPGDPQYEEFKRHIGGIEPGQSKPVPAWSDERQSPDAPTEEIVPPEP